MIQMAEDSRLGVARQGAATVKHPRGHHAVGRDATRGARRERCGPTAGTCTVCVHDTVWRPLQ